MLRFPVLRNLSRPLLPVSALRQAPRPQRRLFFTRFPPSFSQQSPPPSNTSFSARLKHLIKTYGWYALGVYAVIGVADFTVSFAAINLLGAQQVSQFSGAVKDYVTGWLHTTPPEPGRDEMENATPASSSANGSLYAMIVLAYTVHKTIFLPVRVGLTAWLTPRFVKWLQLRGWAGGAGTRRAAEEMRERLRNARSKAKS